MKPETKLRDAVERYNAARIARDEAIREAHASGMSYRTIARVADLSFQRVAQLAAPNSKPPPQR